ncbi:MAG TPA: hypothetical protein DCE42_28180 [Myxococcales bacterium]|nr:hypothetical protein [Deltaproteobacteria bacterium]MBU53498.1 hypothetical protein [Deltaproteobacteria bacterium]HAA58673.1 hypothetical protein [Myxococcales bacterium]
MTTAKQYPSDSIQFSVEAGGDPWWEKTATKEIERGRLVWAFLPHVDQIPSILLPEGRDDPTDHNSALFRIKSLNVKKPPPESRDSLPIAAMPKFAGEVYSVHRAKKRPALLLSRPMEEVDKKMRQGMARIKTNPTLLLVPSYGAKDSRTSKGWNTKFLKRMRRGHYPQFIWDMLPMPGTTTESVFRLDHLQPMGSHHQTYEPTEYKLSDTALQIVEDWFFWYLTGLIDEESELETIRELLMELKA